MADERGVELGAHLRDGRVDDDLADVVLALAGAAADIAALLCRGPLAGALGAATGAANADGDSQKALDVLANELILAALGPTRTAWFASEEEEATRALRADGTLAVAVDPLDGSSNIDLNVTVGTIFSVFRVGAGDPFLRPGREQVAAGYFVYGPHTALVLSTGQGVDEYVLDRQDSTFRLVRAGLTIAPTTREYAINASNHRHWYEPVRVFVEDCVAGATGPRGKDFNMRWIASLVAETHRIFHRGGVFLYPADQRPGYEQGRLRLLYEAFPIAWLVVQAGGAAIDGYGDVLSKVPSSLHERTPLVFGSAEKVEIVRKYHVVPHFHSEPSPLFGERGLFRS